MTEIASHGRGATVPRLVAVAVILAFTAFFPGGGPSEVTTSRGFVAGFLHPIQGIDHRLAMVAVGMWGAALGRPLIWILPVAFPLVMAVGGMMGLYHVPFPNTFTEQLMIALSVIVLGAAVAFNWEAAIPVAIAIVSVFAIFHGYAHGREYAGAVDREAFAVGFVVATGLLHIAGVTVGWATDFRGGTIILRVAGVITALAGASYFLRALHVVA
jgi:urease accessory protein